MAVWDNLAANEHIFIKLDICIFLEKSFQKFQISLKSARKTGNLHEVQYKFTRRKIQIYTQAIQIYMQSNTNLHAEQYKFTRRAIQIYMQSNTNLHAGNTNLHADQYKFTRRKIQIYMQSNINLHAGNTNLHAEQ